MKCGLLPMSRTSMRFVGHLGYHDYEGPAVALDERERLVRESRSAQCDGIAEPWSADVQPERRAGVQHDLQSRARMPQPRGCHGRTHRADAATAGSTRPRASMDQPGTRRPYGELEWHAMRRLLEADDRNSGFRRHTGIERCGRTPGERSSLLGLQQKR